MSFAAATMATGIHDGTSRWLLPDRFAHAVVPIIVGYITAHYLSYFVEVGQQTLILLSDPLGRRREPARHREPPGELLAVAAPDAPGRR